MATKQKIYYNQHSKLNIKSYLQLWSDYGYLLCDAILSSDTILYLLYLADIPVFGVAPHTAHRVPHASAPSPTTGVCCATIDLI
jgi:hypothetical protein